MDPPSPSLSCCRIGVRAGPGHEPIRAPGTGRYQGGPAGSTRSRPAGGRGEPGTPTDT